MKIIADDTIPFLKGIAEPVADVVYIPAKGFTPEVVKDADALIVRSIDKCTSELLAGSRVRLITTATIGFENHMGLRGRMHQDAMRRRSPSMS